MRIPSVKLLKFFQTLLRDDINLDGNNKDVKKIRELYKDNPGSRNVKNLIVVSITGIFIAGFLSYQEIFIMKMPVAVLYWRFQYIIIAALTLALVISPFKQKKNLIKLLYIINLMSLVVLMCGITSIIIKLNEPAVFNGYLNGFLLIIFIIYILAPGGITIIFPIYSIVILYIIFYLYLIQDFPLNIIIPEFSNILIAIVVFSIMGEITERLRFREFYSRIILEKKNKYIEDKNKKIHEELEFARIIQLNMIPKKMPVPAGAAISAFYKPMSEIGGDFYDFINFKETNLQGIFISDVSGHGVPAALITGMLKSIIETADSIKNSPADFIRYINDKIVGMTSGNFITALYAVYDDRSQTLTFSRAGHCYPLLVRDGICTELISRGKFMGIIKNIQFEEKVIKLKSGDRLLLYTDGLSEARSINGEEFGKNELIKKLSGFKTEEDADLAALIYKELVSFCSHDNFDDDICIITLEIN